MPEPVSNFHAAIETELVCWKCREANRPGVTMVVADFRDGTAYCLNCSADGQISKFQPEPLPEGEN